MASLKELEGLTYTEYINKDRAYMVLQNWDKIFASLPKQRQNKINNQKEKGIDPLFYLKKIVKMGKEVIHTKYNFSKQLVNYGRLFPQNPSLACLPKEIRNTISKDIYYDVDMKNCHPNILSQYCEKNNIKCELVDYYVNNREEVINKICEENKLYNVSPSQVKNSILTILNGGNGGDFKISKLPDTFIYKLKNEIKNIHSLVCKINAEEFKKVQKRKDFNPEGSMMNIVLCKIEHQLLINAVAFMKNEGYNVDVLIFDGFMIRKNKELGDVLYRLKNYIKEKTDYNMEFIIKEMNDVIDLSSFSGPVKTCEDTSTYLKDKEEFEKTHIKIMYPSLYLSMLNDKSIEMQNETALIASHRHMKTTIKNPKDEIIKTSFINMWLNDENIRLYRRLVFVPNDYDYDKEDYNSWRGFAQEEVKLPDDFNINDNKYINDFKAFLNNLCNGETKCINYFIAWMANIIQNPSERACVCLILYSLDEGVGKNMVIKTLEKCLGSGYVNYITDVANQLFGKHSSAEMNKLLIVMNEVKGKDTYANTDIFKSRITDDKREVELKGKDTIQINNYASYIINTNNLNMVNAGEKDRRYCVIDCNNPKINNKKYFKTYEKEINNNPVAIRCIYEYLKTFDIVSVVADYIFSDSRPRTDLYEELLECNREKEWNFLEHMIKHYDANDEDLLLFNNTIWELYVTYCRINHYDISKLSSNRFFFIFNRSIIQSLNRNVKYENIIRPYRETTKRGYHFNIKKLIEYFTEK
jgi:hypothetical protein